MIGVMFIVNANDGACSTSHTGKFRLDHVFSSFLFQNPSKTFEVLAYYELYEPVLRMRTDPTLTVLEIKRCMEADRNKTATKDKFVRYEFTCGGVVGFEKVPVQVEKRAHGSNGRSTRLIWVIVHVFLQADG